jgi:hypothetical protein
MDALWKAASAIMNYDHLPFGNEYYATASCGGAPYDPDTRHCWAAKCVATPSPQADCFNGTLVAQHGDKERDVNRMMACAKQLAGPGDPLHIYWGFVVCMESAYETVGVEAYEFCGRVAQYDVAELGQCFKGPQGDRAVAAVAKRTVDHPGTPYVLVNGESVDPQDALRAVCDAYSGTKPAGCSQVKRPTDVCI